MGEFTKNLDLSEKRVIEQRLAEIQPMIEEAGALRHRLAHVHRRLGLESHSHQIDRSLLELLDQHPSGLARGLIIRDLGISSSLVKSSIERLEKRGKIESPSRGYWRIKQERI